MEEIWKDVIGYEGAYQVSSMGRIKSFKASTHEKFIKFGGVKGYQQVTFYKKGKYKTVDVHRVVLIAFVGEGRNGDTCDHVNSIKDDNRLSNLQWVSQRENNTRARNKENSSSLLTGASWSKPNYCWKSCISFNKKAFFLGYFETDIEASNAYREALLVIEKGGIPSKSKNRLDRRSNNPKKEGELS